MSDLRRRFVRLFSQARAALPAAVQDAIFALPVRAISDTPALCRERGWTCIDLGARVERMPEVVRGVDDAVAARILREVAGLDRAAPAFCAVIPEGRVHTRACTAIAPPGTVLADVSPHAGVPADMHRGLTGSVVARRPRRLRGRSALVGGVGHRNFYHWMFDNLPRIGLVRDARLDAVERWLVPATDLGVAHELLARAGLDRTKLEPVARFDHVVCDELVVTSAPGEVCEPTPRSVEFLRGILPSGRSPVPGKRVYVARRGRRRVVNEAELEPVLRRFGFRIEAMEGKSLDEQIAIVAGAEAIVAPHGAALSHMIHAADRAVVIECMPPGYFNPSFFVLAGACGLRYAAIEGVRVPTETAPSGSRNFAVDAARLERALGSV